MEMPKAIAKRIGFIGPRCGIAIVWCKHRPVRVIAVQNAAKELPWMLRKVEEYDDFHWTTCEAHMVEDAAWAKRRELRLPDEAKRRYRGERKAKWAQPIDNVPTYDDLD